MPSCVLIRFVSLSPSQQQQQQQQQQRAPVTLPCARVCLCAPSPRPLPFPSLGVSSSLDRPPYPLPTLRPFLSPAPLRRCSCALGGLGAFLTAHTHELRSPLLAPELHRDLALRTPHVARYAQPPSAHQPPPRHGRPTPLGVAQWTGAGRPRRIPQAHQGACGHGAVAATTELRERHRQQALVLVLQEPQQSLPSVCGLAPEARVLPALSRAAAASPPRATASCAPPATGRSARRPRTATFTEAHLCAHARLRPGHCQEHGLPCS